MTPRELRERLLELIGTDLANFGNGRPAIWVGHRVPAGAVGGLQCVIQDVSDSAGSTPSLNRKLVLVDQSWQVTLINFSTQSSAIPIVIRRIRANLGRPIRNEVYLPETQRTREQLKFQVYDPATYDLR